VSESVPCPVSMSVSVLHRIVTLNNGWLHFVRHVGKRKVHSDLINKKEFGLRKLDKIKRCVVRIAGAKMNGV